MMLRSHCWWILTVALAALVCNVHMDALGAQRPKPSANAAPKPEAGDDEAEAPTHMEAEQQPAPAPAPSSTTQAGTIPAATDRAAIDALIDKAGKEPPEWWNSVQLNVPATLDLSWPIPAPPGPWNPNRNISQYYISIINPDPSRHREGCKLMHQILTVNANKPVVRQRAMAWLGRIYGIYLQDYARGAFWYRKAAKAGNISATDTADLGFYYWKLGSRAMALETVTRAGQISPRTVRVLGSMGEVDKALAMAKRLSTAYAEDGYLAAGDAYRYNGRWTEAVNWYQKVLALTTNNPKMQGHLKRYQDRASADIQAIKAFQNVDVKKVADGVYNGQSIGYRGPVAVEVTVRAGRIQRIEIAENQDDWPLNALETVPAEMIDKQSVQGIDMTSGATFTAEAVLNATGKALSTGMRR